MKRCLNGVSVELTDKEILELESMQQPENHSPTLEEQVIELRQALDLLLSGATEV